MAEIAVKKFQATDFQTAEALKTLRSNLIFSGTDIQAVELTSFNASEGKSTVSFQLALSMAQAGKRVVLVDADLRKSVLASSLKVRERIVGLSHFLSGQANLEDTLCQTDVPGFFILFAGARVPNSSELLGSPNFRKMIPALKNVFDYVIVDAAPLGLVIDAAVMAPVLDGAVLVIDSTKNSYRLERRILQQLKKSGGKVLGVVLNRVNFKDRGGYYGGKKYGYGYGYGYGGSDSN